MLTRSHRREWAVLAVIAVLAITAGCSKGGPSKSAANSPRLSSPGGGNSGKRVDTSELAAMVGKTAPDWELADHTGKVWMMSKLRGKAVLLISWATW